MATRPESRLQQSLSEITRLLDRHRVLEALAHQQDSPKRDLVEQLQHRQNVAELGKRLRVMHAADIAHVLESLPLGDRMTVWREVSPEQAGDVFVEVSEAVRESLIERMDEAALVEMLTRLDPEDLAYVSASLSEEMRIRVEQRLEQSERTIFEDSIRFPRSSVGHVMTREWVEVSDRHAAADRSPVCRRCPPRLARDRAPTGVVGVGTGHADHGPDARRGRDLQSRRWLFARWRPTRFRPTACGRC